MDDVAAAARAAVRTSLRELGVSDDDLEAATRSGELAAVAVDRLFRVGVLTAREVAALGEQSEEQLVNAYRMLGIDVGNLDDAVHDEAEVTLARLLERTGEIVAPDLRDEILRAAAMGLSLIAESTVAAFVGSAEESVTSGRDALERAATMLLVGQTALEFGATFPSLFRHHLRQALAGQRMALVDGRGFLADVSIGFADLVGFTSMSARLDPLELLDFVREFERQTFLSSAARCDDWVAKIV